MSRYAPVKGPEKSKGTSSRTRSEPSGWIRTPTCAAGREYDFAAAGAGRRSASAASGRRVLRSRLSGELHRRRLARGVVSLEVGTRLEVEEAGDQRGRHRLERIVVREDGVVVDLARDGDLLLRLRELRLELLVVLRRPELRVGLRDGEEAAE